MGAAAVSILKPPLTVMRRKRRRPKLPWFREESAVGSGFDGLYMLRHAIHFHDALEGSH